MLEKRLSIFIVHFLTLQKAIALSLLINIGTLRRSCLALSKGNNFRTLSLKT
jgi:hypothetical protein